MHLVVKKTSLPPNVRITAESVGLNATARLDVMQPKFSSSIQYFQLINCTILNSADNTAPATATDTKEEKQFNPIGRDPAEYEYNLDIMMTDGVDKHFIRNIWQVPISDWNSELMNHWLCRLPHDERENPQLVSITHYKRCGNYRYYEFCCVFATASATASASSSSSSQIQYSDPIWVHYGALKRSVIYHDQTLCGKKYQWNWGIMQKIDDGDYEDARNKTAEQWFDEMEIPVDEKNKYKIHTIDEAIKVMKLYTLLNS